MAVRVCEELCSDCIFRPGNLMKLMPGRRVEMVRNAKGMQGIIPCHQKLPIWTGDWSGIPTAEIDAYDHAQEDGDTDAHCPINVLGPDGKQAICRGYWDRYKDDVDLLQVAQRLNYVEFV